MKSSEEVSIALALARWGLLHKSKEGVHHKNHDDTWRSGFLAIAIQHDKFELTKVFIHSGFRTDLDYGFAEQA